MANMSYCRFQNTRDDVKDCIQALEENGTDNLSEEEHKAMKEMFTSILEFALDNNIIDEYYEEEIEEL